MILTKEMVLSAVDKACNPSTNYIRDQLRRENQTGFSPALVLSRLKALEADKLLTRSRYPNGYYGYTWKFTEAGRAALPAKGCAE